MQAYFHGDFHKRLNSLSDEIFSTSPEQISPPALPDVINDSRASVPESNAACTAVAEIARTPQLPRLLPMTVERNTPSNAASDRREHQKGLARIPVTNEKKVYSFSGLSFGALNAALLSPIERTRIK